MFHLTLLVFPSFVGLVLGFSRNWVADEILSQLGDVVSYW